MRCRLAATAAGGAPGRIRTSARFGPSSAGTPAAVDGDREGLGEHLEREQHAGAHGRVVGDGAGEPDGGERRRPDDLESGGRDPYGSVRRRAVGHGDVLTEVLVQRRHRGRAEDDLTRSIDAMAAEDGRGDRRGDVLHEERHVLAVDLHVVVRGTAVGGHVPVVLQHRERHLGDVATPGADRLEDVRPVPTVQGRPGDQCLQAVPERQRRHDECHGKNGPEQRRAHRDGAAALAGLEGHAHPDDAGSREPGPRRRRHHPRPSRRPDAGAQRGAVRCGRERQQGGDRTQQHDENHDTEAQNGPVEGDPSRGVDGTHGSERRKR